MRSDAGGRSRLTIISALGVVEILTWGSSFYLPAVLAGPVAQDTGWPLAWVVGGLTLGLFVAALASPHVGTVARPGLVAQALAPPLGAIVVTHGRADVLFVVLTVLAMGNLVMIAGLWTVFREDRRRRKQVLL